MNIRRQINFLITNLVGVVFFVVGWISFIVPNKAGVGGVTGIATLLGYIIKNDDLGWLFFVINVPLLVLSFIYLSKAFCFKTGTTLVLIALVSQILTPILPKFTEDRLLYCVVGGFVFGIGLGLIFRSGATSGGSDIAAALIKKRRPHAEIGWVVFWLDVMVICCSSIVYHDLSSAAYGGVIAFVYTLTLNYVLNFSQQRKLIIAFSKDSDQILKSISSQTDVQNGACGVGESNTFFCLVPQKKAVDVVRNIRKASDNVVIAELNSNEIIKADPGDFWR